MSHPILTLGSMVTADVSVPVPEICL